jgi:hypothetical protein
MSTISYVTINLRAQRVCPTYNKTDMLCSSLDGELCVTGGRNLKDYLYRNYSKQIIVIIRYCGKARAWTTAVSWFNFQQGKILFFLLLMYKPALRPSRAPTNV